MRATGACARGCERVDSMEERMQRLLIVSNRLPVTVKSSAGNVSIERSVGGLATGLSGPHARTGGEWIGWPGTVDPEQRASVGARLAEQNLVPVWLEREDVEGFYDGFSNAFLWPLFHYQLGSVSLGPRDWEAYEQVNRRFATAAAERWKPGDRVWVHDYQLLLVPGMLRELVPEARIGFFLHIPFPSSAVLRGLPHHDEILRGMLGADLIGFHTAGYLRHFAAAALRALGVSLEVDRIRWGGRDVALGVFPMGIDAQALAEVARSADVLEKTRSFRGADDTSMLLAIDRLDYTKGITRRLMAFARMLELYPELRGRTRLIQVAVPSRADVAAYQSLRRRIDGLVGSINGTHGTPNWTPVTYLHQSFDRAGVSALLRAADVLLVTPVRDGMNLVAKEFAAVRDDEDGVLVLSELAGAAHELGEALFVNPYDIDASARTYQQALTLPREERRRRMRAMRERVRRYDVHRWADGFLERLDLSGARAPHPDALTPEAALRQARDANELELLLDYDGTLREFEIDPTQATPSGELLELLRGLCARTRTRVHLVSGRRQGQLESWFGELDLALHAEHGLASRWPGGEWTAANLPPLPYAERIAALLEDWATRIRGAFVERKDACLAFHWRAGELGWAARQVRELRLHLLESCGALGVEVLVGNEVLEVRPAGLMKGLAFRRIAARVPPQALIVAFGDDRTDDELFEALPAAAISVRVGSPSSAARVHLPESASARRWLARLLG